MAKKKKSEKKQDVDTGGGAYIGGSVSTGGGDFVGRDKTVKGDEVRGNKVTGDTYSGDFRGAILNVRSKMKDVTQSIGAISQADEGAKAELERLVGDLQTALEAATQKAPEKAQEAEAVAEMTQSLVDSAKGENPNKTMVQITGEGLKRAAENIADVMPTVLDIATKIVMAVGAFIV